MLLIKKACKWKLKKPEKLKMILEIRMRKFTFKLAMTSKFYVIMKESIGKQKEQKTTKLSPNFIFFACLISCFKMARVCNLKLLFTD